MADRHINTIVWAIITCLLWSTAYPFIKIGLQYSTPIHFAGTRFMISGLMILPFTVRLREYIRMIMENRSLAIWVTILQTLINYILFYKGMDRVPGALGAVIVEHSLCDSHRLKDYDKGGTIYTCKGNHNTVWPGRHSAGQCGKAGASHRTAGRGGRCGNDFFC